MPAQPPSDDSQLPQLRRFRLESDGKAHEVGREGAEPVHDAPRTDLPVAPQAMPAPRSGPALDDPDQLLAAADAVVREREAAPLVRERQAAPLATRPTSGAIAPPAAATGNRPSPGLVRGPLTGPTAAPLEPSTGSVPAAERPRRSPTPMIIAAIAAIAAIALVAWLVLRSTPDEQADDPPPADQTSGQAQQGEQGEAVPVDQWADAVCTGLSRFQTNAMPLKAAATQLSDATPAEAANELVELRREAGTLLGDLAAEIQAIGMPSDEDIAAVHTDIVLVANEAAASVKQNSTGAVGSPSDSASAVTAALEQPLATFVARADALPDAAYEQIAGAPACQGMLG